MYMFLLPEEQGKDIQTTAPETLTNPLHLLGNFDQTLPY